jgi:hypothetical protein
MTSTDDQVSTAPLFTARDRCDRCGAQAHMLALLVPGLLLFCAHHGHQYEAGLAAAGAEIEWS